MPSRLVMVDLFSSMVVDGPSKMRKVPSRGATVLAERNSPTPPPAGKPTGWFVRHTYTFTH